MTGITLEIDRKKGALYDYNRHIENGGAPTEERDDDGYLIGPKISFYRRELRIDVGHYLPWYFTNTTALVTDDGGRLGHATWSLAATR